ncbi:hypothetical protein FQA39_LY03519 [Lamprigera yunnana]|nr:hypothetical protein FQA39_LY03519 [Lamprigera yunnana]
MNRIVSFNKTYEERLQEFTDVLGSGHKIVSASSLSKMWTSYLELSIHSSGWLAMWKIPRLTCEQLNIDFPVMVLVRVENVDFRKLSASIKVINIDEETPLWNKHFFVSLIELWPIIKQSKMLNIKETASVIDMLRVFYIYLFMPWDLEEDDSIDWMKEHLESRLTLFYDMRSDVFPQYMVTYLQDLLTQARHLHSRQKQLQIDSSDDFLHCKLDIIHIRNEVEFMEDPLLRRAILQKQQLLMPKKVEQSVTVVIPGECRIDGYLSFLADTEMLLNHKNIQLRSNFVSTLENLNINDTILLGKFFYELNNISAIRNGGTIKGLYLNDCTTITSTKEDIILDCSGNFIFENITFDVRVSQCTILVRKGKVTLNGCIFNCTTNPYVFNGIIVLPGAELNINGCIIKGYNKAIVVSDGGKLYLKDSHIINVNIGLTLYNGSSVNVETCKFTNCREYGIGMDVYSDLKTCSKGGFEILKSIPNVTIKDVVGKQNGFDSKINYIGNLGLPEFTESGSESSDNEMDTTVFNINI